MNGWNDIFTPIPLRKHRLYTGDISNHIEVKSVEPLSDDELEEYVDGAEEDGLDVALVNEGEGDYSYLVTVGFVGEDGTYEYVVYAGRELDDEGARDLVAKHIEADL